MKVVFTLLALLFATVLWAQPSRPEVGIQASLGNSLAWWRYNRGTGLGWDRTDNIRVPIVAAGLYLESDKWRIYAGVSREWWNEKEFELFEDNTRSRRRLTLTDKAFPITDLELKITHYLVSKKQYKFGVSLGAGTFFPETELELQNNFGTMWLWTADVINQFRFKTRWAWLLGINYEKKIILPEVEQAPNQRHELFSYGLWIGLNYKLF